MRCYGIGVTDVGRQRDHNEDAHLVSDELGLYIVADGMGGHASGEVASLLAIASVEATIRDGMADVSSRAGAVALVRAAAENASRDVHLQATADPTKRGMGCTLTLAWMRGGYAAIAHVGDSRCYLYRNEYVSQLTSDHTVAAELVKAGAMKPSEVEGSSYANMLARSIGAQESVKADAFAHSVVHGDTLLLCSDGLSNYVPSSSWLAEQIDPQALEGTAEELVAFANESGGRDNITAVLVSIQSNPENIERQQRRRVELNASLQALGGVFLFDKLKMGLLSRVLGQCRQLTLATGEELVEQGGDLQRLVVVTRGQLMLRRDDVELAPLAAGQHVGITSLLQPRAARASLVASEPSAVLSLGRRALFRLIRERPLFGINILERLVAELSRELAESVDRRDDNDPSTTPLTTSEQL